MALRILIVDDEPDARALLRTWLLDSAVVEVVGEAGDGHSAVKLIQKLAPDAVLLDIQMPEIDGFEVMRLVGAEKMPAVVFVTAYDTYAVKAFEVNAIDYLLKPYDRNRLDSAINRLNERIGSATEPHQSKLKNLLEEWRYDTRADSASVGESLYVQRLFITSQHPWLAIETRDIEWIAAAGNYADIHTAQSKHLITESLAELERRLNPSEFLRVHRSAIVNLAHINKVRTGRYGTLQLLMHSGTRIKVSRSKRDLVRARLIKQL